MSHSRIGTILRSSGCATVAAIGIAVASATGAAASPEDEIARLNRVRANLFEELVKTRAEAAAARAELEAAVKGREAAEAELTRMKQQEAAGARPTPPAPGAEAKPEPRKPAAASASGMPRRQSARPAESGTTGSIQKTVVASAPQRVARSGAERRAAVRLSAPAPRPPAAPALPSVLRLQDPQ